MLVALKLPSTPQAPERAVLAGLARLGARSDTPRAPRLDGRDERAARAEGRARGARHHAGFEDLLEIGRQDRPDLYSLAPRRIASLVPPERRLGIDERVGPGGVVWRRLAPAELATPDARGACERDPQAIAIGLLHAYANPSHERRSPGRSRVSASRSLAPPILLQRSASTSGSRRRS